jgi:peptidoglycan/xylan/chitin deacetylase (PgdA/CDA1 family)
MVCTEFHSDKLLDEVSNQGEMEVIYSKYQEEMAANADDSIIVLLHGWTPEALDLIIPDLVERGYQFGVLPRSGDPVGPVIWD